MKTQRFILLFLIFIAASCAKDHQFDLIDHTSSDDGFWKPVISNLKIAVVSDIHYMDPSLLRNNAAQGQAFQNYLAQDPKLLEYSDPIFKTVLSKLKSEKPDILLIPGDLTKDGEKVCHEAMAGFLKRLEAQHIKIYVIPGNHDINNPEAARYDGDHAYPIPSVSDKEFSSIYADFGYKDAISRDPNSLSYVCQPFKGLWILGIDDCEYYDNTTFAIVAGKIKPLTMTWILQRMAEARKRNITVLAMMHHGIMEHYTGQNQLDPGYVTDNWEANADAFISAGLKVMFTGHYHANDITLRNTNRKILYDIETGSLVTPPSPYRVIAFDDCFLNINTKHVTSINAALPGGLDFVTYSNLFLSGHLDAYFNYILTNYYSVPPDLSAFAAPLFRDAMMAHFAGDEKISPAEQANDDYVGQLAPFLGSALQGIWTDLPPQDNKNFIRLK
jgi:3',5'-cyclic AMP phosphodiesterase CpdA